MSAITPVELHELYFRCWEEGDFEPLRQHLADDVAFDGVMGTTRGPDDFIAGVTATAEGSESIDVRGRVHNDSDVMTWYALTLPGGASTEVVNWAHLEGGLLTQVRVTFDPRPMLGE